MKLNLEKLGKKNICLIGLMGSGKSVIGKSLARELNIKYYDSDKLIEKKLNKSINQIFSDHGEKYFRNIEEVISLKSLNASIEYSSIVLPLIKLCGLGLLDFNLFPSPPANSIRNKLILYILYYNSFNN